jgi:hypothetical protein
MALQESLNVYDPISEVGKVMRGKTTEERGTAARQGYEKMLREQSLATENIMRQEKQTKEAQISEEERISKDFAGGQRRLVEGYQQKVGEVPQADITKFDAPAAAEVAGMTALLGALTGMAGGRAALKSMAKFTEGHKLGREDLYKTEVANYERDLKQWKDNNALAKQFLDQSIDLLSTDKTAAMVSLKRLDPILQDGLILAKVRQGKVVEAKKDMDKVIELEGRLDLAVETALGKPAKIDSKVRTAIREGSILIDRLEQLKSTAKPQYFQLSGGLPSDKFAQFRLYLQETSEGTTVGDLANILGLSVDNAAVQWWKDYADLIADVRKERFGATLTGNEKQSFRQTVIEPSSSYQSGLGVLDRQLKAAERSYNRYLSEIQRSPTQQAQQTGQTDNSVLRQQAQAAIESGKDPAQVRARYKQLTGEDL